MVKKLKVRYAPGSERKDVPLRNEGTYDEGRARARLLARAHARACRAAAQSRPRASAESRGPQPDEGMCRESAARVLVNRRPRRLSHPASRRRGCRGGVLLALGDAQTHLLVVLVFRLRGLVVQLLHFLFLRIEILFFRVC